MRERPLKLRNGLLAPRALAVISCGLALLALQPTAATMPGAKGRTAVMSLGQVASANPVAEARPIASSQTPSQQASQKYQTLTAGTRRLHILATVEILQRLLLAELQPRQQIFTQAMLFEPLTLSLLDAPLRPTLGFSPASPFVPPPAERQFAIEHCLLAPPQA